jgi:hypothetical protein
MFKNIPIWFPEYIKEIARENGWRRKPRPKATGLKHILFLFVDHFELAGKAPRLGEWMKRYPSLASGYHDADGFHPRHSWFYAMDLLREEELIDLRKLVEAGLGEVELHWHHSYDTTESFLKKLQAGLTIFQKHGFMRSINPNKWGTFAFIHGNWSLDNSLGEAVCGVRNEIELLLRAGCYGDFTFPALFSKAQPSLINSIYYAREDGKSKSYNRGRLAQAGMKSDSDELMILEGPLTINWQDWRFLWHPMIENGEIGRSNSHGDPVRIDAWVRQGICVTGRHDWIFVKVFCHGGQDYDPVLGDETDKMFSYLEKKYNDGTHYQLHYITAREAYNLVKAAEEGKSGNPNLYRNYIIPPQLSF